MTKTVHARAAELLAQNAELLEKKGQDYGGGDLVDPMDYYKFEKKHPNLQILHTKVLRYASLSSQDSDGNFESVEDTLKDIMNYAALAIAVLEKGKDE